MNAFDVLSPARRGVLALLLVLALSACSKGAWAGVMCWGSGETVNITLPAAIHVPRDATAGTVLVGWRVSPRVTYPCKATEGGNNFGIYGMSTLQKTYTSATMTGAPPGGVGNVTTYRVIESGVPGIGLAMAFDSKAGACDPGWRDVLVPDEGVPPPWVGWQCNNGGDYTSYGRIAIAIVKTGTASAGVVPGGNVAQATAVRENIPDSFGAPRANFNMTPVQIVPATCTTPDVPIPLGSHYPSEFGAIGTTTAAVDFSIRLDNCPAGMERISYRIDPTTPVIDSAQSVVALNNGERSATGVGVQLLDGSGNPFKLRNPVIFYAYDRNTVGNYAIPMKARYYKTAAKVTAGPANTAMTVTMSYR